jgi:surfeit locus 1 family protein
MTILSFVAILLFLSLGFWQLERADEKKQMLTEQASLAQKVAIPWVEGLALPKQYQRISVMGHYLDTIFFLDNQHHQHQFGYHVIVPLLMDSGQVLLIDRGWVAGDPGRQYLPDITNPKGLVHLTGSAYYPSGKNWVLGQFLEKKSTNKSIIEQVDSKLISQFLHKSVYAFIMRIDNDGSQDFVREWPVVAMPPERHYAYAVQWFAIASVVLILFIALNLKKNYEND